MAAKKALESKHFYMHGNKVCEGEVVNIFTKTNEDKDGSTSTYSYKLKCIPEVPFKQDYLVLEEGRLFATRADLVATL